MAGCGLFVTGTDTDVGKTAVAVAIVRHLMSEGFRSRDGLRQGLRVGVYKPVSSGVLPERIAVSDAALLWEAAGRPLSLERVCPQMFAAAISPPRSSRAEGRRVDEALLWSGFQMWQDTSDVVIVEGAGGLFSPLGDTMLNADLAVELGLPLVLVDASRLGAIGRTLAVSEAAVARGLRLAAVVLSDVDPCAADENRADPASRSAIARASAEDLADRLKMVPVLRLSHRGTVIEPAVDWLAMACGQPQRADETTPN